jgi:hypothetical protein
MSAATWTRGCGSSKRASDALVLAAAGLRRLGFGERISMTLPSDVCVPAPGQGIVAIETREHDAATKSLVARITDTSAAAALDASARSSKPWRRLPDADRRPRHDDRRIDDGTH